MHPHASTCHIPWPGSALGKVLKPHIQTLGTDSNQSCVLTKAAAKLCQETLGCTEMPQWPAHFRARKRTSKATKWCGTFLPPTCLEDELVNGLALEDKGVRLRACKACAAEQPVTFVAMLKWPGWQFGAGWCRRCCGARIHRGGRAGFTWILQLLQAMGRPSKSKAPRLRTMSARESTKHSPCCGPCTELRQLHACVCQMRCGQSCCEHPIWKTRTRAN